VILLILFVKPLLKQQNTQLPAMKVVVFGDNSSLIIGFSGGSNLSSKNMPLQSFVGSIDLMFLQTS
jgi:hypothetical protein